VLSENGKKRALTYQTRTMRITTPKVWDGKWRVVIFDIPEDERDARDSLREHLNRLGFYKLQQSVAIHPFDCRDEIDFVIELHAVRKYVRCMIVEQIDNERDIKRFFKLENH
jgi:DNA-binding transcriptional regulator PaaX